MPIDSYLEGTLYENFICRAYNCSYTTKNGAHQCFMSNLINAENGDMSVKHLLSAEKQLVKVKMYMIKAFDKFLKQKGITFEKREKLEELREMTSYATNSTGLMDIVKKGLEITQN